MHGILAAVQNLCPRVHVFDSLAMVDTAVKMAEARCQVYHGPGCKFYVKKVICFCYLIPFWPTDVTNTHKRLSSIFYNTFTTL